MYYARVLDVRVYVFVRLFSDAQPERHIDVGEPQSININIKKQQRTFRQACFGLITKKHVYDIFML